MRAASCAPMDGEPTGASDAMPATSTAATRGDGDVKRVTRDGMALVKRLLGSERWWTALFFRQTGPPGGAGQELS